MNEHSTAPAANTTGNPSANPAPIPTVNPAVPSIPEPLTVGPVTRTDFVRYQGASGDMNPIHHDEEYAKAAGFETPFAVGMWQASLLGTYATDWLGADNVRNFRIRFLEQVWPGDVLSCSGEVVKTYEQDGEQRVDVELTCLRQTGGKAVTAWASFVVPNGTVADATGDAVATTADQENRDA